MLNLDSASHYNVIFFFFPVFFNHIGKELRCLSSSGPEHSSIRWGVLLHFVKVKIRPCVPHCSSSSWNPSPAAGLISSSQRSLLSLSELRRLRFDKVYLSLTETPLLSQIPIFFCSVFSLHLVGETIPPNQGFADFTRPHPCQEILLGSSSSTPPHFYKQNPCHAPG